MPREDIDWILRKVFKKTAFRSIQREVIEAALNGEDIFVRACTGFGKSICYQLPAIGGHGISLVISPLLSLMANQVAALQALGIKAAALSSSNYAERDAIYEDLSCGHPKLRLLYVTPELCTTQKFRSKLAIVYQQNELNRIVIDEAHCISEWGHDFRPSFQQLDFFRSCFRDVPIMCLTATATEKVKEDTINILKLEPSKLKVFKVSTSRPNLHLQVRFLKRGEDQFWDFVHWFRSATTRRQRRTQVDTNMAGIIYCQKRDTCDTLAARLREHGIEARSFHAGLNLSEKNDILLKWSMEVMGFDVIVATTAFGMGVDKPNVRYVIHWSLPKSFESYYQEIGRAGRDGLAAYCLIYYSIDDQERVNGLICSDLRRQAQTKAEPFDRLRSFHFLARYCLSTTDCKHTLIDQYFDGESNESQTTCNFACDFHKFGHKILEENKLEALGSEFADDPFQWDT